MDDDYNIYDTVTADQDLTPGDNVAFTPKGSAVRDYVTLTNVVDEGDSILVTGDSYVSGDRVTYILTPDHEVHLWTV